MQKGNDKRPTNSFFCFILMGLQCWLCAALVVSSTLASESVTLAVGHWPPYVDKSNPGTGVLTQKVLAVYRQMDVRAELRFDDWHEVLDTHLHKPRVVSYGWVKNDEREQQWYFSEPVGTISYGFWVRNSFREIITDYQQLDSYLIGVGKGYSYGQEFEDNKHRFKQADFMAEREGFHLLLKGRIDVFIGGLTVGEYFLSYHKNWREHVYFQQSPLLGKRHLYLVCMRTTAWCQAHIVAFNHALQQLGKP